MEAAIFFFLFNGRFIRGGLNDVSIRGKKRQKVPTATMLGRGRGGVKALMARPLRPSLRNAQKGKQVRGREKNIFGGRSIYFDNRLIRNCIRYSNKLSPEQFRIIFTTECLKKKVFQGTTAMIMGRFSNSFSFSLIISYFWSTGKEFRSLAHSQQKLQTVKDLQFHACK